MDDDDNFKKGVNKWIVSTLFFGVCFVVPLPTTSTLIKVVTNDVVVSCLPTHRIAAYFDAFSTLFLCVLLQLLPKVPKNCGKKWYVGVGSKCTWWSKWDQIVLINLANLGEDCEVFLHSKIHNVPWYGVLYIRFSYVDFGMFYFSSSTRNPKISLMVLSLSFLPLS